MAIPQELRDLPQWVCAGNDKIPYNPRTKTMASVTNPDTWSTYEEAVQAGFPHVGFVLTSNDPYAIIDLDSPVNEEQIERHQNIIAAFDSHTETSMSGQGMHIIVKGEIPRGVRRDKVEVYSSERYMICTGNTWRDKPIIDYQERLDQLFHQMGGDQSDEVSLVEIPAKLEDSQVVSIAINAVNGEKVTKLMAGDWESDYPSQSEADFALLSLISFYTDSNEQVRRMFKSSGLANRKKGQTDNYLNICLKKIRANEPPKINFENLRPKPIEQPKPLPDRGEIVFPHPPGFLGLVADDICANSIRPVPEIALAASIALFAGICGRQFNVSGTGLNLYLILLARTGMGKEGAVNGIDRYFHSIRTTVPAAAMFRGPASFASGQSIYRHLSQSCNFLSVLGEFGLTFKQWCNENTSGPALELRRTVLEVFSKSGQYNMYHGTVYSDREKNVEPVRAPALTLLGETVPETFLDALDDSSLANGLVPRFITIEYRGERPQLNKNVSLEVIPELADRFKEVVTTVLAMMNNDSFYNVPLDPSAKEILDVFETTITDSMNEVIRNGQGENARMEIWNRAHLKALKLAALAAVADRPQNPQVTQLEAEWAVTFVKAEMRVLLDKFELGAIGSGDEKRIGLVKNVLKTYIATAYRKLNATTKSTNSKEMHADQIVSHSYLTAWLINRKEFRAPQGRTARQLVKETLELMMDMELLIKIPPQTLVTQYSKKNNFVAYRILRV